MTIDINCELYEQIEISKSSKKNVFIIRNIYTNKYFQVGEEEYRLALCLKNNDVEQAQRISNEIYGQDIVSEFHEAMIKNSLFDRDMDKGITFSLKKRTLNIPLNSITKFLNNISFRKSLKLYYVFNSVFSIISIYFLYHLLISININLETFYLNMQSLFLIIVLLMITVLVHEIGHAIRLRIADKEVGPISIFFKGINFGMQVDVSESYVLENNRDKIGISFAGVYTQLAFTGIVCLILQGMVSSNFLFIYLVLNWIMIINNLIPFMKLDGYWILSNYLDINNLSQKAKNTFINFLIRYIYQSNITIDHSMDNSKNRLAWGIYGAIDYAIGPFSILTISIILSILSESLLSIIVTILLITTSTIKLVKFFHNIRQIIKEQESNARENY